MKFIKSQNLNPKLLLDNTVSVNTNNQVILNTTEAMLIPKGTTAERPGTPVEGFIRYNTDDDELEAYQNGAWRELAYKEPVSIIQQRFGPASGSETLFGPLDSGDPDYEAPSNPNNILVFVGSVVQIATINYVLTTVGADVFVDFNGDPPPLDTYITVIHGFDR